MSHAVGVRRGRRGEAQVLSGFRQPLTMQPRYGALSVLAAAMLAGGCSSGQVGERAQGPLAAAAADSGSAVVSCLPLGPTGTERLGVGYVVRSARTRQPRSPDP